MAGFLAKFRKLVPGAAEAPQPPPRQADAWTALAGRTEARPAQAVVAEPPPEQPVRAAEAAADPMPSEAGPPAEAEAGAEAGADADFAFDEEWYLYRYPDVAAAVRRLPHASARGHYITHGRREGRLPVPPADWDRSAALAIAAQPDDPTAGAAAGRLSGP